jgi:hypothetical protein
MPEIPEPEKPYQLVHVSSLGATRELLPLFADEQEALARGRVVLAQFRDDERDGLRHAGGRLQLVDHRTGTVIVDVAI